MIRFNVLNLSVKTVRTDVLVLGIFSDIRPLKGLAGDVDWIHQGVVSRLILNGKIIGKIGETALLATQRKLPTPKVLIQGLGDSQSFGPSCFRSSCLAALESILQLGVRRCALELFGLNQCVIDTTKYVDILTEVIKAQQYDKDLEVSLLIPDQDKAFQVRQQLIERSVVV